MRRSRSPVVASLPFISAVGNLVATAWKDKKVVNITSTLADPADHTTVTRRQKDGTQLDVQCPLCVALYKYMGSVDLGDQLRGSYHVRLASSPGHSHVFNVARRIGESLGGEIT